MPALSTLEQLLYSTVRIEVDLPDGKAVGSGFFASLATLPGKSALVLVSNRHLLESATSIRFWMTLADTNGNATRRFVAADITSGGDAAFGHPEPETDLAAVIVTHLVKQLEARGDIPFYRHVPEALIPTDAVWSEFDAAEEVVMMGAPWGLHDEVNKLPLARRGSVASYLPLDYGGKPEFVLDIAAFEGSSGSPVFLNSLMEFNRETGLYHLEMRSYLLGVFKSALEAQIVQNQKENEPNGSYPLHLGLAIKSTELHALFDVIRAFAARPAAT